MMKSLILPLLFVCSFAMAQPYASLILAATGGEPHAEDLFIIEDDHDSIHLEDEGKKKPAVDSSKKETPQVQVDVTGKGNFQILTLANGAYEKGEFEEAIAYYRAILDKGISQGDLFFNLANSYFRTGDFGRAMLFYEKAMKLRPRDMDIRHNLAHARTFLIDKEIQTDRLPGSMETLLILHRATTTNETLWLLAGLSFLLGLMQIFKMLHFGFAEKALYGYLKGIVIALLILQASSAGFKVWVEAPDREGIILNDSVKATASPTSGEQLLELNSGTKVTILQIRNGYAHIRLPNGVPAFITANDIGEV